VRANPADFSLAVEVARLRALAARLAARRQAARAAALVAAPLSWGLVALPPDGEPARHAERALELLRQGVQGGYAGLAALQLDSQLMALPQRATVEALFARAGAHRRYASVWHGDTSRQAEGLSGLSPGQHLARCRLLAAQGYRPVALSLA